MKTAIITALLMAGRSATAQNPEPATTLQPINLHHTDSSAQVPFQATFFYPMGTNGVTAPSYENNFSFNILYGINGGVKGTEIGGLVNVNKGNVDGVQIGGIANVNSGYSNGTVIGGIANVIGDSSKGVLIAGISNVVGDSASGIHVAGISNTINGNFEGGQVAGIANLNNGTSKGFQLAGIANISNGNSEGLQLSGIANVVHGEMKGAQLGLINFASAADGVQIGLINFAGDGENVVPVGLISFVKNGYRSFEFSATESVYGNAALKMGVEKFYTIFRFGLASYKAESILSYGMGFGSLVKLNEKNRLGIDISCNNIRAGFGWNWEVDLLSKIDFTWNHFFGRHFSLFAGPSFNVYVSQHLIEGKYGSISVPYTLYSNDWSNGNVSMWIGANAGIAVRF
jgi:hypothetical protein